MLHAVLLAALAAPLQSGGTTDAVAPLQGEHWFELADRLEFELRFDESIIARIEGLRLEDVEQQRRELARQLQHVAGRVATIRPRVPMERQDDPISWSVAGDRIAIHSDRIRVHDAVTGATLFTSRNNDRCQRDSVISLSPDGRLIVHNSPSWSRVAASIEDIESGETVFQLDEDFKLLSAAWSPDVQRLALVLDSKESGPRVQVRALPGFELVRSFAWASSSPTTPRSPMTATGSRSGATSRYGSGPSRPVSPWRSSAAPSGHPRSAGIHSRRASRSGCTET